MLLENARKAAYDRGLEVRPVHPVDLDDLCDQAYVADIIHACLDEIHPASEAPSRRHEGAAFEAWVVEGENIRTIIFDAYDLALRGKPFKPAVEPVRVAAV